MKYNLTELANSKDGELSGTFSYIFFVLTPENSRITKFIWWGTHCEEQSILEDLQTRRWSRFCFIFKLLRWSLHTFGASHRHRTSQDLTNFMFTEEPQTWHFEGSSRLKSFTVSEWSHDLWTWQFLTGSKRMWFKSHVSKDLMSFVLWRIMNSKHWRSSWTCPDFVRLQIFVCAPPRVYFAGWREELRNSVDVLTVWRFYLYSSWRA